MNTQTLIDTLADFADQQHVDAYLVGGFVRDELLQQSSKDIDIVCVGDDGVGLLTAVANQLGWHRPQVFERFGTAQVRDDDFIIETVRARAERYDPESRKPDVRPGTLEEDIWRRDFTVNALCRRFRGEVIDITGRGLQDLQAGVLRTPLEPRETFSEDPLRMFRAARFVAQLGFTLAEGVLDAMRQEAHRATILSIERVSEELRRLVTSTHPRLGMNVLRDGGLLDAVLPELMPMVGVEQGGYHTDDVFDHTMHALDATPPDLVTRLAALFHDIGKPATHALADDGKHTFYNHPAVGAEIARTVMTRLRFSNDEVEAVALLVALHLRPIQYQEDEFGDSAVRRLIRDAGPWRAELLDVARADTKASSYPDSKNIDALEQRMQQLDQGEVLSRLVAPISGEEIMAMAGRPPGEWVGVVKRALEEAVLEGEIEATDAEQARAWLQNHPALWQAT